MRRRAGASEDIEAMRLLSIEPRAWGPFTRSTVLEIDRRVTVITGPNDVGKSSLLSLLSRLDAFDGQPNASETDVNLDAARESDRGYGHTEAGCVARFELDSSSEDFFYRYAGDAPPLEAGDQLTVQYIFASGRGGATVVGWARSGKQLPHAAKLRGNNTRKERGVKSVFPLSYEPLSSSIDLRSPGAAYHLLAAGYPPQRNYFETLNALSAEARHDAADSAGEALTRELAAIMPAAAGVRIRLGLTESNDGEVQRVRVNVADRHGVRVPLNLRGTGLQRLVSLFVAVRAAVYGGWRLLLLDEPEAGLHADAQHQLRRFLEDLAEREDTQVIYATHSGPMINSLRAESVRVLGREKNDQTATVTITGLEGDFQPVRASWGMTAADSLQFGLVTVVVEGSTEASTLGRVLERLTRIREDAEDLRRALAVCTLVDGGGDSFHVWARAAMAQGSQPIVLLDGDKAGKAVDSFRKANPTVPVVLLPMGTEFEDIVPRSRYMEALASVFQIEGCTEETFDDWLTTSGWNDKSPMFSKQVAAWLLDKWQHRLRKRDVMRRAVDLTADHEFSAGFLSVLLEAIRSQLTEERPA
jgi:ABC-type lipoprotein export system ATPase subunit